LNKNYLNYGTIFHFFNKFFCFILAASFPIYLYIITYTNNLNENYYVGFLIFFMTFIISLWIFFDLEYEKDDSKEHETFPENRDIKLSKYTHVNDEITRYRNLSWQIVAFAWAIYYGTYSFLNLDREMEHYLLIKVSRGGYVFFTCLIALAATIFLLFCEHTANRNKVLRRGLEERLELDTEFGYTPKSENLWRAGFWISVFIFLGVIWVPILLFLFFK